MYLTLRCHFDRAKRVEKSKTKEHYIMKLSAMEYEAPAIFEHQMFNEGVLCISGAGNENYGGDPGEDETIF